MKKSNFFLIWVIVTIFISILAFNTIPHQADDLYRYFYWIDYFRINGLSSINDSPFSITPISNYILFLISLTSKNNYLPMFVLLVESTIVLTIIFYYFKNVKKIPFSVIVYGISILLVSSIYISISGFRFNLAIIIGSLVLYKEFINKRNKWLNTMIFLILPLIHTSAIIFLAMKILVSIKVFIRKPILIIPITLIFIISLDLIESLAPAIFDVYFEKINIYKGINIVGQSFFRNVGYALYTLFLIIMIKRLSNNIEKYNLNIKQLYYLKYMIILIYFIISLYIILPEFYYRITSLVSLISLPLIHITLRTNKRDKTYIFFNYVILGLSLMIFLIYEYLNYYVKWNF